MNYQNSICQESNIWRSIEQHRIFRNEVRLVVSRLVICTTRDLKHPVNIQTESMFGSDTESMFDSDTESMFGVVFQNMFSVRVYELYGPTSMNPWEENLKGTLVDRWLTSSIGASRWFSGVNSLSTNDYLFVATCFHHWFPIAPGDRTRRNYNKCYTCWNE